MRNTPGTLLTAYAAAVLAPVVSLLVRLSFDPGVLDERALYITFTLPSNVSLDEGRQLVPRISELVAKKPEVESVLSQLGRPEDGTDATLTNNLEYFVRLKPPEQWPSGVDDLSDVITDLGRDLASVPGLEANFSQPIRDNVNENISGQFGQIAVKVYGADSRPDTIEGWQAPLAGPQEIEETHQVIRLNGQGAHRYYLIWFTKLPEISGGGGFRGVIDEAVLKS